MKGLRIGRRRGRDSDVALSPLELALRPALVDGRWQIPDRFNFTRDVVEALARDPKRRALTSLGKEGVIEHKNFLEIADGAAVWATTLREAGINPGDRVLVVAGTTVDWLEIVLGTLKAGAVVVPCMPNVTASVLERVVSSTDAALVVGARSLEHDDRADGLHAGRPPLRGGAEAELEGRPRTPRRTTPRRATSHSSSPRPESAGHGRTSRTRMRPPSRRASRPSTGWTSAAATPSGAPRTPPPR